jgi:hypothetical protein
MGGMGDDSPVRVTSEKAFGRSMRAPFFSNASSAEEEHTLVRPIEGRGVASRQSGKFRR